MASLSSQLEKLEYISNITKEKCQELMNELDEHDKQIKIKVLDEFAKYYLNTDCPYTEECLNRCFDCLIKKFKEQINGR